MQAIGGSAYSSWPSARAEDSESCGNHPGAKDSLTGATSQWQTPATDAFRSRGGDRKGEMGLDQEARNWSTPISSGEERGPATYKQGGTPLKQQAMRWPTPNTAPDSKQLGSNQKSSPPSLGAAVELWATPRTITGGAESAERKKELGRENSGGGDLQAQVENWPTPRANDAEKNGKVSEDKRNGLIGKVEHWPTQASRNAKGANSLLHCEEAGTGRKHMDQRPNFVAHSPSSPQVQVTSVSGVELSPTGLSTALRRRLNPAFVCWLMGWPWWWTNPAPNSCARAATGLYLFRLRSLLAPLLDRHERFLASGSKGYDVRKGGVGG